MLVKNDPASPSAIENLLRKSQLDFPDSYLQFLSQSNGGSADSTKLELFVELLSAEEIIGQNDNVQISEFLPNFFIFGNDGANELLTFKLDEPHKWAVFQTPLIVMSEEDSILLAHSFEDFLELI